MLPEPLRHGVGGAIREEGHGLTAFQIDQHRAIDLAFPQAKIIDTEHSGGGACRDGLPAKQAQQGVPAYREAPALAQMYSGLTPKGHAERDEALGEPQGAPRPGGGHGGQAFREDPATAVTIAAEPLADAQLETHAIVCPRQIGQGPFVTAVDTPRRDGAQWKGYAGLRR